MPALIPQPHGGALLSGGVPGNRGGYGVKEKIRAVLREHLNETMIEAVLEDWRQGKSTALQVAEFCAHYGVGTQSETVTAELVKSQARRMLDCLEAELLALGWTRLAIDALGAKMERAARGEDDAGGES